MAKGIAGMPASPGIVDGPVHLLRWEVPDVRHRIIHDEAIPGEIKRFHDALEKAKALLHQVRERAEGWRIALGVLAVFVLYSVLT